MQEGRVREELRGEMMMISTSNSMTGDPSDLGSDIGLLKMRGWKGREGRERKGGEGMRMNLSEASDTLRDLFPVSIFLLPIHLHSAMPSAICIY
jgi:hypothetical protein